MTDGLQALLEDWEGVATITRKDAETGAWFFICLDDMTLGPCSGGTRMKVYPTPAEGLLDAQRLAGGMTRKWAVAGLPYGGGKAVIALENEVADEARRGLLYRYGELVESLGGIFQTGEDLGTTTTDLLEVARRTRFVHGFDSHGRKLDPSPYTARGVYSGLCAALEHTFEESSPAGRSILIEGVGNVGKRLAAELAGAGAKVLIADLDSDRAERVAGEIGGEAIPAATAISTACDVYAPCAVGGTLQGESIPTLSCRIVAGSANNQLGEAEDADRLRQRGIVYAPDFIINSGGAMAFALLRLEGCEAEELFDRVSAIGRTIGEVLMEADNEGVSSLVAAERRASRTLSAGRSAAQTAGAT